MVGWEFGWKMLKKRSTAFANKRAPSFGVQYSRPIPSRSLLSVLTLLSTIPSLVTQRSHLTLNNPLARCSAFSPCSQPRCSLLGFLASLSIPPPLVTRRSHPVFGNPLARRRLLLTLPLCRYVHCSSCSRNLLTVDNSRGRPILKSSGSGLRRSTQSIGLTASTRP